MKFLKAAKLPLKALISLMIIGVLLTRMDLRGLAGMAGQVHIAAWGWAIGCMMLQIALLTVRWVDLINLGGRALSYNEGFRITVASQLSNVLLITSIGGIVVRIALAVQAGVALVRAVAATALDRAMTLFALVVLSGLALPRARDLFKTAEVPLLVPVAAVSVMIAFVLAVFLLKQNPAMRGKLAPCVAYLEELAGSVPLMLRIVVVSLAAQILYFSAICLVAFSMKLPVDIPALLTVLPLMTLIASLPVSIGGWGIREGAFVYGLGLIGIPMEQAFLISVQIGIISLLATVLSGLPALVGSSALRGTVLKLLSARRA